MRKKSRSRTPWGLPLALALLGVAASMAGCQWDSSLYDEFVVDDGQGGKVTACESLTYIVIAHDNGVSKIDVNNGEYENSFKFNICPKDAPNCTYIKDSEGDRFGICNNCLDGQSVCKGRCLNLNDSDLHINNTELNGCENDVFNCKDGFADVDTIITNGCEYDFELMNVEELDGKTISKCKSGFADVDGDIKTGCEYELSKYHVADLQKTTDGFNFSCVYIEGDGYTNEYADCNDDITDGCETDLITSNLHCGECGNKCRPGTKCDARVCGVNCLTGSLNCGGTCVSQAGGHIESCSDDEEAPNLVCAYDYYDLDGDFKNGCEFQLSINHINPETPRDGDDWNCEYNYFNSDKKDNNGCELNLSDNHIQPDDPLDDIGKWNCKYDYYDLDERPSNGCEYKLSDAHINSDNPVQDNGDWNCAGGFGNCDGKKENGCEYDLDSHNTISCSYHENGTTTIECKNLFANLDKDYSNGCEINGGLDIDHCGAQGENDGIKCNSGNICNSGTC